MRDCVTNVDVGLLLTIVTLFQALLNQHPLSMMRVKKVVTLSETLSKMNGSIGQRRIICAQFAVVSTE